MPQFALLSSQRTQPAPEIPLRFAPFDRAQDKASPFDKEGLRGDLPGVNATLRTDRRGGDGVSIFKPGHLC